MESLETNRREKCLNMGFISQNFLFDHTEIVLTEMYIHKYVYNISLFHSLCQGIIIK